MGLYVSNLRGLPQTDSIEYYVYLLDYGWHEPLTAALKNNFIHMADLAAKSHSLVLAGTNPREFTNDVIGIHFEDDLFSWDRVNGEGGDYILPAIMITNLHPSYFLEKPYKFHPKFSKSGITDNSLILIPIKKFCKETQDVLCLVDNIFHDIAAQKPLLEFSITRKINKDKGFLDALILEPNISGIGIDLKKALSWLKDNMISN